MAANLEILAEELGALLRTRGWVIGTAESCTGGMVAAAITDVAGSSAWFDEGLVTYANNSKQSLLGVSEAQLADQGAVSKAVVEAMAVGVLGRGSDLGVATSGVAGPGGGTSEKPVGTVWFAWAVAGHRLSECVHFSGGRPEVRAQATYHALMGALEYMKSVSAEGVISTV